ASLGPARSPVCDVSKGGQDDPEPVPPIQTARAPEDHVDKGGEGQEDEAEQRPDPGVEGCVHHLGSGHPDDEERETWEDPREQCEPDTHVRSLLLLRGLRPSSSCARSASMIRAAASMRARCENACGKLPRW